MLKDSGVCKAEWNRTQYAHFTLKFVFHLETEQENVQYVQRGKNCKYNVQPHTCTCIWLRMYSSGSLKGKEGIYPSSREDWREAGRGELLRS